MDEFQQSDLGKERNDSHDTFYQNTKHYKERENAFVKNHKCCVCICKFSACHFGGLWEKYNY